MGAQRFIGIGLDDRAQLAHAGGLPIRRAIRGFGEQVGIVFGAEAMHIAVLIHPIEPGVGEVWVERQVLEQAFQTRQMVRAAGAGDAVQVEAAVKIDDGEAELAPLDGKRRLGRRPLLGQRVRVPRGGVRPILMEQLAGERLGAEDVFTRLSAAKGLLGVGDGERMTRDHLVRQGTCEGDDEEGAHQRDAAPMRRCRRRPAARSAPMPRRRGAARQADQHRWAPARRPAHPRRHRRRGLHRLPRCLHHLRRTAAAPPKAPPTSARPRRDAAG